MSNVIIVDTVATLAATATATGAVAYLSDPYRAGEFAWRTGNYSAQVTSDPAQGIYVASSSTPSSSGAWVREWDGTHAQAEWFGAVAGNSSFTGNVTAFNHCLDICPVMMLRADCYWITGTWNVTQNYRSILGEDRNGDPNTPLAVTTICLNSSTQDILLVGFNSSPGGINNYARFNTFRNITFYNVANPTPSSTGALGGQACVRIRFGLNNKFQECYTINGIHGYYFDAAVYCELEDCGAQRILAGTTSTNDFFHGCTLDGTRTGVANTGIASCYIRKLNVQGGGNGSGGGILTRGVFTGGGITDMRISQVETSQCDYGIVANCNPSVTYGAEDGWIEDCILDQCIIAITVNTQPGASAVTVRGNYCGTQFATSGSKGIYVTHSGSGTGGGVSLIGNQILGAGNGSIGIHVDSATGVLSDGNIINEASRPILSTNSFQCRFTDTISNSTQRATTGAVELSGSARIVLDCMIYGMSNAFPAGYALVSTGNSVIEARVTGIDLGAIDQPGGVPQKLEVNGTNISLTALPTPVSFSGGVAFGLPG